MGKYSSYGVFMYGRPNWKMSNVLYSIYLRQSCDKVHITFIQSDLSKSLSETTFGLNLDVNWYPTFIHSSKNALC